MHATSRPVSSNQPGIHDHLAQVIARSLARLALDFGGEQRGLADPQSTQRQPGDQRRPQQHMDPNRGVNPEFEPQREAQHQRADDHGEKRRRTIANVVARIVEPAGPAARGEFRQSCEQRLFAAARAQTEKGSRGKAGLPFRVRLVARHDQ